MEEHYGRPENRDPGRFSDPDGDNGRRGVRSIRPSDPDPLRDEGESKKSDKTWMFGLSCVGCGIVGCLGSIVLAVLLVIGGFWWVTNTFLSKEPIKAPPVNLSKAQAKELDRKLEEFRAKIKENPDKPVSLTLTDDQINYYFQEKTKNKNVRMYVKALKNDKLEFKISVPITPEQNSPYYMNITGKGKIKVVDGRFASKFDSFKIGKFKPPIQQDFDESMNRELDSNQYYRRVKYRLKSLKVEDGKLHMQIVSRSAAPQPPETTGTPKEAGTPEMTKTPGPADEESMPGPGSSPAVDDNISIE